jgi:hypothetical protein
MSKILKHLKKNNILITTEELYPKTLLRGFILGKKKNICADNSSFFIPVVPSHDFSLSEISRNVKSKNFQNTYFTPIKFSHSVGDFQSRFDNLLSSFNKILYSLNLLKSKHIHLFLLEPLKSGFRCIFTGLFGFVFTKTLKYISFNFEVCTKNLLNLNKIKFLNFWENSLFQLWVKLPENIRCKLTYLPCVKRKRFSRKVRKFKMSNSLNVIFLLEE